MKSSTDVEYRLGRMDLEYLFSNPDGLLSSETLEAPNNVYLHINLTSLRRQYIMLKSQRSTSFQHNIFIGFSQQKYTLKM
jgi:hypothetical protein